MDQEKLNPDPVSILETMAFVISDLEKLKSEKNETSESKREKEISRTSNDKDSRGEVTAEANPGHDNDAKSTGRGEYSIYVCSCLIVIIAAFFVYGLIIFAFSNPGT